MDRLAKRLRDDAANIEAQIADDLDYRINASLQGIEPREARAEPGPGSTHTLWWASSLTGIVAAIAVIAVVNLQRTDDESAVSAGNLSRPVSPPRRTSESSAMTQSARQSK